MQNFSETLINWYNANKRTLPWRTTKDPYCIWLSEIILQQTRVDQGLPYYLKFIELFPTVFHLANASEEEVLNAWKGLGYYSRARNLKKSAEIVVNDLNGIFPKNFKDLLSLKGVGEYTAAAVASFCYNEKVAVVDGNVYRVLARLYNLSTPIDTGVGKKEFKQLANELISEKDPATFNQAIMEFGALQCVPKNPSCSECPFVVECQAKRSNLLNQLPVKSKKIKRRNRYFNYLVISKNDSFAVEKRTGKDIWEQLFQFPLLESKQKLYDPYLIQKMAEETFGLKDDIMMEGDYKKHVLSHQDVYYAFWRTTSAGSLKFDFYEKKKLEELPFPKLLENYISNL